MRASLQTRLGCAALLSGCLALGACGLCGDVVCGACPSPLTLKVKDAATGDPVQDVTIEGATASCAVQSDLGYTGCDVELAVGTHDLVVGAPGYADQPIQVTINPDSGESCCSCGYNAKMRDVALTAS